MARESTVRMDIEDDEADRTRTICCFNRVHSSSSCGFNPGGGCIQKRFARWSKSSSTVMNDLNVIKKFLLNAVSVKTVRGALHTLGQVNRTHVQARAPSTVRQAQNQYPRARFHPDR